MDISTIFKSILDFFITLFTCFSLLFSGGQSENSALQPKHPNELITSISVVSDTHVETNNAEKYSSFTKLIQGIKSAKTDTAVFLGDNVINGNFMENRFFYTAVKRVSPAENILLALGNHDIGNGDGDYNKLCKNFLKLNAKHLGNHIEKPYYYKVINGCFMIFLATEESTVHSCKISEEQFNWLKSILNEAKETDAPILLFNHHPLYMIEGVDKCEVTKLLRECDNLIYITGHTHWSFDEDSFCTDYGVKTVYLPCSTGEGYPAGDGLIIEVYKENILLRACNFIDGKWIEALAYEIPLS